MAAPAARSVDGVPVGRFYDVAQPTSEAPHTPLAEAATPGAGEGSIITVIATDAPLDSRQLTRLAKRAALGLAVTAAPVAAQKGATITIAQPADATTMDPGRSTQVLTVNYFHNLYDTLTRWDVNLKLQPALATAQVLADDLVVPVGELTRADLRLVRGDHDRRAVLVGAAHHQDAVAAQAVVAGEDVRRHSEAGDVADVPRPVRIRPRDGDEDRAGRGTAHRRP